MEDYRQKVDWTALSTSSCGSLLSMSHGYLPKGDVPYRYRYDTGTVLGTAPVRVDRTGHQLLRPATLFFTIEAPMKF
ncbi:hypothetical protein EJ110_NYTH40308 [Nymphaea thermarum]|nr:hypothetical protein EJ110_NYTH40308 [Nymphaea thermarum]